MSRMQLWVAVTALLAVPLALVWAGKGQDTPQGATVSQQAPPKPAGEGGSCCPATSQNPSGSPAATDAPPSAASAAAVSARASEWLEPGDRDPFDLDFRMTDQDGRALALRDLAGVPMAVSFVYTRCPDPNLCPTIVLTMAQLQRDLDAADLDGKVKLVLITYDPIYDTPQRLRTYGDGRGLKWTNAVMLRPDPDEFGLLLGEFQVGVGYRPDGSIGHFIELILVDHQGRFVRDYQGQVWDNAAVLADLKRLVADQERGRDGP